MAEGVRFRFLSVVGEGGFGRVYHARMETDEGFSKDVAIKVLSDPDPATSLLKRFRDEAKILGLLRDRAIVSADPPILIGGRWAVVMEFVDGVSLGRMMHKAPVPPGVAVEIVGEVARALHHAFHQDGPEGQPLQLLHRDIKPDNIQLTPGGEVKVLDFGIARANFAQREFKTRHALGGTPGYIAPERLHGTELPVGDVYSLGVVLHESTTAIRPKYAPTVEIKGYQITAATEDLEVGEHHLADEQLMEVVRLAAWMRADEAEDRPSAREVEDWCRQIRQKLPPPYLREWAEAEVPHRNDLDPDDMVGQVMTLTTLVNAQPGVSGPKEEARTVMAPTLTGPDPTVLQSLAPPTNERGRLAVGALLGGGVTLIAVLAIFAMAIGLTIAVWSVLNRGTPTVTPPDPVQVSPNPSPNPSPSPDPPPIPPTPPPTPTPVPVPIRIPKVIVVDPEPPSPTPHPAPAPDPVPVAPPPPSRPTGTVLVRTIPSGGGVYERGVRLQEIAGGYALPVGSHVLRVVRPDGQEETTVAVSVETGGTVAICYDFDANRRCAQ